MIQSFFLIAESGEVLFEKHWRNPIASATISERLLDQDDSDKEPVLKLSHDPLTVAVHIKRNGIYFVGVCSKEVAPIDVIELLDRIFQLLGRYFQQVDANVIADNVVLIYELLDEVLDDGYPVTTEFHCLKEIIRPPNVIHRVTDLVTHSTNVLSGLAANQLSGENPWRRPDVVYTKNEMYFDVMETLDAIIDRRSNPLFINVSGAIEADIRLTGNPVVTVTISNHRILNHVGVHACVKLKKWEKDRVLSFVPPDGAFRLLSYQSLSSINASGSISLPVDVQHKIGDSEFEVTIKPKNNRTLEAVVLLCEMAPTVSTVNLIASHGKYTFEKKKILWTVGHVPGNDVAKIKGSVSYAEKSEYRFRPTLQVFFTVPKLNCSGIRISKVDVFGVPYKAYKGVKYVTKTGKYEIRT